MILSPDTKINFDNSVSSGIVLVKGNIYIHFTEENNNNNGRTVRITTYFKFLTMPTDKSVALNVELNINWFANFLLRFYCSSELISTLRYQMRMRQVELKAQQLPRATYIEKPRRLWKEEDLKTRFYLFSLAAQLNWNLVISGKLPMRYWLRKVFLVA